MTPHTPHCRLLPHAHRSLKVEEFQALTPASFTERYTSLVQRLSLMLLQVRGVRAGKHAA